MRLVGLSIILAVDSRERLGRGALNFRIGKIGGTSTTKDSNTRFAPYMNPGVLKEVRRASTPELSTQALSRLRIPAGFSEEYHVDYIIGRHVHGTGRPFELVRTSPLMAASCLHPELCHHDIEGTSLSDMRIVLHTRWQFTKHCRVRIHDRGLDSLTIDVPFPSVKGNAVDFERRITFTFPEDGIVYAQTRDLSSM